MYMEPEQYRAERKEFEKPSIKSLGENYMILGLFGEFGELCEKIKKRMRDGDEGVSDKDILLEAGDFFWYAHSFGDPFEGGDFFDQSSLDFVLRNYVQTVQEMFKDVFNTGFNVRKMSELVFSLVLNSVGHDCFPNGRSPRLDLYKHILWLNIAKLRDRKNRNVLGGSGDHR